MKLDAAAFMQFWRDTKVIGDIVHRFITSKDQSLKALPMDVRNACTGMSERTLAFAHVLLQELADISVNTDYAKPPLWYNHYLGAGIQPVDWKEAQGRFDEFLMEQLTAVWLGLYFLSTPLGHPWERVQRIAEEQGGYPAGACMTKMIGDVYRRLRQERHYYAAEQVKASKSDEYDLIALSSFPSLLFKDLLMRTEEKKTTPQDVHILGRCYALFQLRLYLEQGGTMLYIVKLSALEQAVKQCETLPRFPSTNTSAIVHQWLAQLLPDPRPKQQVFLYHGKDDLRMSPCTLGVKSGVYSLESSTHGTRFVGNRINKKLLTSLRDRLVEELGDDDGELENANTKQLVGLSLDQLDKAFHASSGTTMPAGPGPKTGNGAQMPDHPMTGTVANGARAAGNASTDGAGSATH
jgi:hypothetical protein